MEERKRDGKEKEVNGIVKVSELSAGIKTKISLPLIITTERHTHL